MRCERDAALARRAELEAIRQECRRLVSQRSLMSAGAAVLPIPGLDMGADVAILMQLLNTINGKFGLDAQALAALGPAQDKIQVLMRAGKGMSLFGTGLTPERIARMLISMGARRLGTRSVARFVPVLGSGLSAGISYYLLRRLGHAHIEECHALALRAHQQGVRLLTAAPVHPPGPTPEQNQD